MRIPDLFFAAVVSAAFSFPALDADNANAFVGMAVAYLHSGRYPLARAALEEAKRIDPSKQEEVDKLIVWIDRRASGQGE